MKAGLLIVRDKYVSYVVYEPPKLPFERASFDLVTLTSVLEHVPVEQIPILFAEIMRVLMPGGIASHHVAHKDHWSDTDSSLHPMNYLQYSKEKWKRYNPPVMFQNRVLHNQFAALLEKSKFHFEAETKVCQKAPQKIHDDFKALPPSDLQTTHTWFTCW
ncbi:class I SAM-dependent methyltransferase [bacterium]|nr:class I SAM-dependent methyltransferase [bacterium]